MVNGKYYLFINKMRKGHRRTQSDVVHVSQKTTIQPMEQPRPDLTHLEITQLLTICNEKIKQKVSNIEVLSPTASTGYLSFRFGQNAFKKQKNSYQNERDEDYLASIPQKKQSIYHQRQETTSQLVKKLQVKDRKFQPVSDQNYRRLFFPAAQDSRPRERRKAQPEKLRQQKNEIRKKLGLKLKF